MQDKDNRFWQLFFELYDLTPRQGPGNFESTRRALGLCQGLPESPEILDLGCGSGTQTLDLARLTPGRITALDNHPPFVRRLENKARELGLADRIRPVVGDMTALTFAPESFDLIWSEGAMFATGFDQGLADWRPLLRPGGRLALTELVWFKPGADQEGLDFWNGAYPPMRSVEANLEAAKGLGYEVLAHFSLPKECWLIEYFAPLMKATTVMEARYPDDETARTLVESCRTELDFYRRCSDYMGYEFFILKKSA